MNEQKTRGVTEKKTYEKTSVGRRGNKKTKTKHNNYT